jgi:SSU ribosomal protein S19P
MVKEFLYRGLSKEDLDSTSLEKLFVLFNSRQRRSLTRGITDGKRKLIEEIKSAKAGKSKNPIKTHLRDLIVLPYMVDVTVNVFLRKKNFVQSILLQKWLVIIWENMS